MQANQASRRRGLTLIEILVVLFIIGVLLALLFPAVQHAREAARRATCQSNLRNLTVAMRECVEAYRRLPAPAAPGSVGGWSVAILPFMEQKTLADELCQHPSLDPKVITPLALRRPAILTCPSAYDGESSIPAVPVGHYVLSTNSNRDWWFIGDALWESRGPWLVGPEISPDAWRNGKGPHDGGFNVANSDGSVDTRVP